MKEFPKSYKKGNNGNIEYKKGWQIERSSDNPNALHQLFSDDKICGVIGPNGNMGFSESLDNSFLYDQYDLENNWALAADKYEKLFGDLTIKIKCTDVFLSELVKFKGFGTTSINKDDKLQVKISPLVNYADDDNYWNVILHEMCHVAAYYKDGSLDHGDTWHYFVDKLNNIGYNITEMGDDIVSKLEESYYNKGLIGTNEGDIFYVIKTTGSREYCGPRNNKVSDPEKAIRFSTEEEAKKYVDKLIARPATDWNPFSEPKTECPGGDFLRNFISSYDGEKHFYKKHNFSIVKMNNVGWEKPWQDGSCESIRRHMPAEALRTILINGTTGTTLYRGIDRCDKIYTSIKNAMDKGDSECIVDLRITSATTDQRLLSNISTATGRYFEAVVIFDKSTLAYKMKKTKSEYSYEKEYLTFGKFKLSIIKKDHYIIPNGKYTTYERWDRDYWDKVLLIRATPIDQSVDQAKALLKRRNEKAREYDKEHGSSKYVASAVRGYRYEQIGRSVPLEETKGWYSVEANFKDVEEAQIFKDKLEANGIYTNANFRLSSARVAELYDRIYHKNLQESDNRYKAKVGNKWLLGNKLVNDEEDAESFESETEPRQRINQLKKDGKLDKNVDIKISKFKDN